MVMNEVTRVLDGYEGQIEDELNRQMKELSQEIEDIETSVAWILGSSRKALEGLRNSEAPQVLI